MYAIFGYSINVNKPKSRLKQAISACGLDKTIEHLPDGLNTLLTNHGTNLSGGQKQKIAVAWALLRDTLVYLFDEASSSLNKSTNNSLEKLILTQKDKNSYLSNTSPAKQTADLSNEIIDLKDQCES